MLEQSLKSSRLFGQAQKLHMDFDTQSSMGAHMVDENEIDPTKVRTALFALVTARFEDAHDIAVKGQAAHLNDQNVEDLIVDLRSMLDEVKIQIDAIEFIGN